MLPHVNRQRLTPQLQRGELWCGGVAHRYEQACTTPKVRKIGDGALKTLARRCPRLEVVSFAYLRKLGLGAVVKCVERLAELRSLDIRAVSGKPASATIVLAILAAAPKLQSLQLSAPPAVLDVPGVASRITKVTFLPLSSEFGAAFRLELATLVEAIGSTHTAASASGGTVPGTSSGGTRGRRSTSGTCAGAGKGGSGPNQGRRTATKRARTNAKTVGTMLPVCAGDPEASGGSGGSGGGGGNDGSGSGGGGGGSAKASL
jgi:hypothetical protein